MATAPATQLTFVVVVFEAEYDLLRLQAASLARHIDPAIVARIVVLDQSRPALSDRARRRLLRAYGPLADRVDVVTSPPGADGWIAQQVLKLTIAREVTTSHYVALDAKNHAVAPLSLATFLAPDGRAHLRWYRYAGHPMESRVVRTTAWLGLPEDAAAQELPATTTPFTFVTPEVRALVAHVEEREALPFAEAFRAGGLIEFPLYALWLLRRGTLDDLHDREELRCPTVWARSRDTATVRSLVASAAEAPPAPFFAVHRSALVRLGPGACLALATFWHERGLFVSRMGALWFLGRARARIAVMILRSRLKSRRFRPR